MTNTLFEWDESFQIGIEELDHEHRQLIDDINRLHEELAERAQKSEIEECLGDIYARMQAHFALEEHVMIEHGYTFYAEHKREHDELLDSYANYMLQCLNGTDDSSGMSIEGTLTRWVMDHIATSDKKMSLMVQEKASFKKKLQK